MEEKRDLCIHIMVRRSVKFGSFGRNTIHRVIQEHGPEEELLLMLGHVQKLAAPGSSIHMGHYGPRSCRAVFLAIFHFQLCLFFGFQARL